MVLQRKFITSIARVFEKSVKKKIQRHMEDLNKIKTRQIVPESKELHTMRSLKIYE